MSDQARTPQAQRPKTRPNRRGLIAAVIGVGCLALSGCQVSPLYGDRAGFGANGGPTSTLNAIVIDPPADRVTQLVRNELVFGLDTGQAGAAYRLALRADMSQNRLGTDPGGAAIARMVRVTASYQLFAMGEDLPLIENTVIETASYDVVGQRFSNERALLDAQARAARQVAATIEAQLASAFASGL